MPCCGGPKSTAVAATHDDPNKPLDDGKTPKPPHKSDSADKGVSQSGETHKKKRKKRRRRESTDVDVSTTAIVPSAPTAVKMESESVEAIPQHVTSTQSLSRSLPKTSPPRTRQRPWKPPETEETRMLEMKRQHRNMATTLAYGAPAQQRAMRASLRDYGAGDRARPTAVIENIYELDAIEKKVSPPRNRAAERQAARWAYKPFASPATVVGSDSYSSDEERSEPNRHRRRRRRTERVGSESEESHGGDGYVIDGSEITKVMSDDDMTNVVVPLTVEHHRHSHQDAELEREVNEALQRMSTHYKNMMFSDHEKPTRVTLD